MDSFLISGICRCCASEGPSKNLINKYKWMGEEEVYSEMLKDCFDVTLHSTDDPATNGGICEVCITQLRNAYNFKKQVIVTEEFFKRRLLDGEHTFTADIKLEVDRGDCSASENDIDAADDLDSEMSVKSEQDEEKPKRRKVTARASTSRAAKKVKAEDAKSAPVSKRVTRSTKTGPEQKPHDTGKQNHNLKMILRYSNASLIRMKDNSGYGCCFCKQLFQEPIELKRHFLDTHGQDIKRMTTRVLKHIVKIDVSFLNCSLCDTDVGSLEELLTHLVETHDKFIHKNIAPNYMEFKFEGPGYRCAFCEQSFGCFKPLIEHMHVHYRNHVCEICGAGFATRPAYRSHRNRHGDGVYPCKYDGCDKTFDHAAKLHEHTNRVHLGLKRYVCHICGDKFDDQFKKTKHSLEAHGIKEEQEAVCTICGKYFLNHKNLREHIRKNHLMERPHECETCGKTFFKRTELKNHMVVHGAPSIYKCEICTKAYPRKKTLVSHMRSHAVVKPFQCEPCGLQFAQKVSLRYHNKTKHGITYIALPRFVEAS